jgi:large subunit ribosomal protein L15
MELHKLWPLHKRKKPKRIGRGGKRGTCAGRGIKGQKARAGRKLAPVIREWIKRYPKLRGYKFKPIRPRLAIVNLDTLERKFEAGEKVTPQVLLKKRIIRKIKGRIPKIKILAKGEIKKPLIIEGCQVSKSAVKKIKAAGGEIK